MTSSLRTWPESLIVCVLLIVVSDYTVTTQTDLYRLQSSGHLAITL